VNQVLSLFFVPLFTVHKGQPYRVCPQCGWDSKQSKHTVCCAVCHVPVCNNNNNQSL
jgi:hypothetical protein